ncbi:hypothetical protein [Rhodobacter ferrooxidans]|uniref:Uncharacterized protein n=1 Tax=Rhodobacter ferrooxidans TaxID=371731 RepID=C8RXJ8_9RHOB|nr:hypothetical protein [Rhodobacter sp. SW2]EEW26723.1 hypothetical protein Rsw2DRAFT_0526 [Rhodobacter sp. SW2]
MRVTQSLASRLFATSLASIAAFGLLGAPTLAQAAAEADAATAAPSPSVMRVLHFKNWIEVTMTDGSYEQIKNGFYQHIDAAGTVLEIRAATSTDITRLLAM